MKRTVCLVLVELFLLSTPAPELSAAPLGTAFTYQGQLRDGGQPATVPHRFFRVSVR